MSTFTFNIKLVLRWIVVIISTSVIILASPIIALGLLLFISYRYAVIKYAQAFRPDLGKALSARSAVFATDDFLGKPKANILVIMAVTGSNDVAFPQVKKDFYNGAVDAKTPSGEYLYPEFHQHVTSFMGFPFFKWDKNFNYDDHFREYKGGPGSAPLITQKEVDELSTQFLKKPWVPGRSPWEVIVYPNCKINVDDSDEQKVIAFIRCHHTFADGFSITKVASMVIPGQEIQFAVPTIPEVTLLKKILFYIYFVIVGPFEFVNALIEAWDVNECHVPESKLHPSPLLSYSGRIPMDYIRGIKMAHGTGFTAVLLTAFTGAVRSLMIENGYKIPDAIHCVTPFPMPGHPDKLRNFMTTVFIRLPIGLPTAEERLLAIDKYIHELKRSTHPLAMFYIIGLIGILPSWLTKLFFKQYGPTTLISNFPGPDNKITYLGFPLEDIMFTAGLLPGNIGIGFAALSYNGSVRIQAAFNEGVVTKTLQRTFLLDKVLQELQILAEKQTV